jgi:putative iron-regulated protein
VIRSHLAKPLGQAVRGPYSPVMGLACLVLAVALAPPAAGDGELRRSAVQSYAAGAEAAYRAAASSACEMRAAVDALCDGPSPERLAAARAAWVRARSDYGATEVYRFGGGPIDARRGGVETFVNAWPVDENYIEPADGDSGLGLIADRARFPVLARAAIREHNQRGGETNVCTGWHAIEFMLWGRDESDSGPGNRPASDFADGGAPNADRRREYLHEIAAMLCEDLNAVARAWAPGEATFRARLVANPDAALRAMFIGPALLSGFEMSGERLAVALETGDQEQEHSCFSDTTDADFKANVRGIAVVVRGHGGPGLLDLVRTEEPARADALAAALAEAESAVSAIPAPFDAAIRSAPGSERRAAMERAMRALERLGEETAASAKSLGIQLPTEPQG